ncbi:biotin--[acetyl-CoA-carboxylase] ligase [Salinifilum ghardaiensis]
MTTPALLDPETLRTRLVEHGPYAALDVVTVTGSTNTDLVAAAGRGAVDRTVLLAEEQRTGRGRRDRSWISPRGFGLHASVLLRPELPLASLARLPVVAGLAAAETISTGYLLPVSLKWPNDVLIGEPGRKVAGILAETTTGGGGAAAVLGMGINVHHAREDLPQQAGAAEPTSLDAEGAGVDREEFAVQLLREFARFEGMWRAAGGDLARAGLLERYRRHCGTIGRQVRVDLTDGALHGTAVDVDDTGGLLLRTESGELTAVSAGDVVHLRPAGT